MKLPDLKEYMHLPYLASEHGKDVDRLTVYVHWLMLVLFIGWIIYFGYVLFRFRERRNPKADHIGIRGHASTWLELAIATVEGVLLFGLAIPLWAKVVSDPPSEDKSTVVRVTAEQFLWSARYPGPDKKFGKSDLRFVSTTNQFGIDYSDPASKDDVPVMGSYMAVPVDVPVIAYITSKDVIHSFKILPMRVTQDATPGMVVPTWFTPTKVGKYLIHCAQLCGSGHTKMKGNFDVMTRADYDKWLEEKAKAAATTATSYE